MCDSVAIINLRLVSCYSLNSRSFLSAAPTYSDLESKLNVYISTGLWVVVAACAPSEFGFIILILFLN